MQQKIFNIQSELDFLEISLQIFKHQFKNNKIYRSFCDLIYTHPSDVDEIKDIPFLPIQFFKSRKVISSLAEVEEVFSSSGTTGSVTSQHFVTDISL